MISLSLIGLILLLMKLVSLGFLARVVSRQWMLMNMEVETGLVRFRLVMFLLGQLLVFSAIPSIVVYFYYAFIDDTGDGAVLVPFAEGFDTTDLLVYYAFGHSIAHLASSIILWNIYCIASTDQVGTDEEGELIR